MDIGPNLVKVINDIIGLVIVLTILFFFYKVSGIGNEP